MQVKQGQGFETLDATWKSLVEKAIAIRQRAYAPYSNFNVGVSILGADGKTYEGCNIETVGYNNSLHAEMVAIGKMVSGGCQKPERVAVVTEAPEAIFPCGFCRQYLYEFGGTTKVLAVQLSTQKWLETRLSELLPGSFMREHVGK